MSPVDPGAEPAATPAEQEWPRYDAFISYSHRDRPVAAGIQKGLHRIGRRLGRLRALRVFRDATDLTANPDLWASVIDAIDNSRYLIVVLSTDAAASHWVNREVEYWLARDRADRMLLAVAGGRLTWDENGRRFDPEQSDAALPALVRPGSLDTQPLYVDVSDDDPWDPSTPLFREKLIDLAAPIHVKDKSDLADDDVRELRRFRRLRRAAVVALVALTVSALVAAVIALNQWHQAGQQSRQSLSRYLLGEAEDLRDDSTVLATLLTLQAFRLAPTGEARNAVTELAFRYPDASALLSPSGRVSGLAVSSDGSTIATATYGAITMWDVSQRRMRLRIPTPGEDVGDWEMASYGPEGQSTLAFSPDGRQLFVRRADGRISLFDVSDGREVRGLPAPAGTWQREGLSLSIDGRLVADMSSRDVTGRPGATEHRIRLWNVREGRLLASGSLVGYPELSARSISFSPDGRHIAVSAGHQIRILRIPDLHATRVVPLPDDVLGNPAQHRIVSYLPDGRLLASEIGSFGAGGTVVVHLGHNPGDWTVRPLLPKAFLMTTDLVAVATPAPLFVVGSSGPVWVWNARTNRVLQSISTGGTRLAAISRDGRTMAIVDDTNTVAVMNTRTPAGTALPSIGHRDVAVSPDGAKIAVSRGGNLTVWDPDRGDREHLAVLPWLVNDLAFSNDGRRLAAATEDGSVTVWDTKTRAELMKVTAHAHPPCGTAICRRGANSLAFADDDDSLFSIGSDGRLVRYDLSALKVSAIKPLHRRDLQGVWVGPDKDTLVFASYSAQWFRSNFEGGHWEPMTVPAHYSAAAGTPSGLTAFAMAQSPEVQLWDMRRQEYLRTITVGDPAQTLGGVDISTDGRTLLAVQEELAVGRRKIILWDLKEDRRTGSFRTGRGGVGVAASVYLMPRTGSGLLVRGLEEVRLLSIDESNNARHLCALVGRELTPKEWARFGSGRPPQACPRRDAAESSTGKEMIVDGLLGGRRPKEIGAPDLMVARLHASIPTS
jgi:WD40 repeat protein